METTNIQARLDKSVIKKIDACKWAESRSEAIRTIIEAFCKMPTQEQKEFLKNAYDRKFAT